MAAQVLVAMQVPATPAAVQVVGGGGGGGGGGGMVDPGVQHSMSAAPAQRPAVETYPVMAAQAVVAMQVPATPAAVQAVGAGGGGGTPGSPPGPHCPKSATIDWSLSISPPGPMSFSICRSC